MNIPNILSIFRLVVTVFFVLAVNQGRYRFALVLFILQGLSDLLDGLLARVMNKKTSLGAYLDPIADKAMLLSAYVVLYFHGTIPLWVAAVILLKDTIVATGFLILYRIFGKVRLVPSMFGKTSTALQIMTVIYVLWSSDTIYEPYNKFFFWPMIICTVVAGLQYVVRGVAILTRREPAS
ncbi:MAG: CDP-alcohol phosphatidyltransferase family protein [Syntrophobacterales bacterium]|jgi:cardiolipin synthase|nr:CDP-alcohol phosphatidyltransferase family protein [Syntrophobacterales bacterium]